MEHTIYRVGFAPTICTLSVTVTQRGTATEKDSATLLQGSVILLCLFTVVVTHSVNVAVARVTKRRAHG